MVKNNRMLHIAVGQSRKALVWQKTEMQWSDFIDRLKTPVRGEETIEQYLNYSKAQQADLKDVGGFVGGTFRTLRRSANQVEGRDLVTLDMDTIPAGEAKDVIRRVGALGCAAVIYSTRKHTGYAPRLRVIIPTDRTVTADEYEPIARKLAYLIGMDFCDPTTFQASRMMYWPSCSADGEYVYEVFDAGFCSADGILNMYGDWKDVSQWPQVTGAEAIERRRVSKQEDPTSKKGIVGAFCRTYTVLEAMEKYIPGMYEPTDDPNRYTYTGGSTQGGAVLYDDDKFLYSYHATDPCSGQLVNAFDLIRLHMYGDKDSEVKDGTPAAKLPSFIQMSRLALGDEKVAGLMRQEKLQEAQRVFDTTGNNTGDTDGTTRDDAPDNFEWLSKLTVTANNDYEKTINNVVTILQNDPLLKGKIATDEFASCGMVLGATPWDSRPDKRRWTDTDDAGLYRYIETYYRITGREKLDNALLIVSNENKINDVKRYLQGLTWDGVKRIDTLLPDYLGADSNPYTHAVMRKVLCAAVARGIKGGVKFDYMPIFTGPQGIGKSTFLCLLGREWFSDSLTTFEGKDAAEMIQGTWINEVGELTAMTRQETNAVKQFLSKREDIYRAAYGRRTEKYPRRCVFIGTSNNAEFLKDATGNRRFWPVDVGVHPAVKSVWEDLPEEVDQIWAEAYMLYKLGEPLYLTPEIEQLAKEQQEKHIEESGKEGIIRDYLEKQVPVNWWSMSQMSRKQYLNGMACGDVELMNRDRVCAVEIWAECFGGDPRYMKRQDAVEINGVLERMSEWERMSNARRFGPYGNQKGFKKSDDS